MWNKVNVKKFCDDSTMHGFKELYYSKHGAKKMFWFLVIVGAIAITAYQVCDAVSTYQKQPTVINVHPMEEEIVPPPIYICFDIRYVLSWVSFKTLNKLDVETDMSFFHFLCKLLSLHFNCYSTFADTNFSEYSYDYGVDVSEFQENENAYYTNMEKQNISNEFLFIKQFIAFPPNSKVLVDGRIVAEPKKMFLADGYICYTYSINHTKSISVNFPLEERFEQSTNENFSLSDISSITNNPTAYNMLKYMRNFGDAFRSTRFLNFTSMDSDNLVMFGIGNIKLTKMTSNAYNILQIVSMSQFVAIDRTSKPCKADMSTSSSYDNEINPDGSDNSCLNLCMYKKQNVENTSCVYNSQLFIGLQNSEELKLRICSYYETTGIFALEPDADCKFRCPEPCTQWFYSAMMQVSFSGYGGGSYGFNIEIVLPLSHSVMVSEEITAYTWTTLISNIGGLLGIWLGASLVSFLQSIFLLLCSNETEVEELKQNEMIKFIERMTKIEQLLQSLVDNVRLLEKNQQKIQSQSA